VIAALIVLSLFSSWTLLAHSGATDPLFKQKGTQSATMSTLSFNSNNIPKDYLGDGLVATEEAVALQSTGTKAQFNFEGDLKTNISVFRPSTGTWWILNANYIDQTVVGWGVNGDKLVPADYDGDGKCDVCGVSPFQWDLVG
jgi:hypothetical protein